MDEEKVDIPWVKEYFLVHPDQAYCVQCQTFLWAELAGDNVKGHVVVYSYEEYIAHLPEIVMLRLRDTGGFRNGIRYDHHLQRPPSHHPKSPGL